MLEAGDDAPDFVVADASLRTLAAAEHGAVVFFFPKAFTPGWTSEAGEFRRQYADLQAAGVAVVGVSADRQDVQDRFAASLELPFPLVGSPDGAIGAAYGVRWPVIGLFRRATFLIGGDGVIEAALRQEGKPATHAGWARDMVRRRTKPEPGRA